MLHSRWPVWRFVLILLLILVAFLSFTGTSLFRNGLFPASNRWNASASAAVIRLLGKEASARDAVIAGPGFSMRIARGCDAFDPIAVFVAGVLAFPGRWRPKLIGIVAGAVLLVILNVVRIVSLFFIGCHAPRLFHVVHVDIWQALFILLAVGLWIYWALWFSGGEASADAKVSPT